MRSFKGAVLSDIHLGNRLTPTAHIIESLEQMLPNDSTTGELDIIFISGDFFDRALSAASNDYIQIGFYISKLLRMCKNRNIILRVLEGTPSHDYNQAAIFNVINENVGANFKYVETLAYEKIPELDIDVIYIPDEYRHTADEVKIEVLSLMGELEIESVDYVIMHGMCTYQIQEYLVNDSMHDHEFYNSITRINTYCGHVHQHSTRGKFVVPGSAERYCFGDEGAKGHIRFNVINGVSENLFIENKNARIYKYLKLTDISKLSDGELSERILNMADDVVYKHPLNSNFKFLIDENRDIDEYVSIVAKKYKGMKWDWGLNDSKKNTLTLPKLRETINKDSVFSITRDNILKLVSDELSVSSVKNINDHLNILQEIVDDC